MKYPEIQCPTRSPKEELSNDEIEKLKGEKVKYEVMLKFFEKILSFLKFIKSCTSSNKPLTRLESLNMKANPSETEKEVDPTKRTDRRITSLALSL